MIAMMRDELHEEGMSDPPPAAPGLQRGAVRAAGRGVIIRLVPVECGSA